MLLGIGILSGIVLITTTAFINISPEFGGKATKKQKELYAKSPNFKEGKFINRDNIQMSMDFKKFVKSMIGYFNPSPNTRPGSDITVQKIDSLNIVQYKDKHENGMVRPFHLFTSNERKEHTNRSNVRRCSSTTSYVGRQKVQW